MGSWKIIATSRPRSAARALAQQRRATEARAAADARLRRQQSQQREEGLDLAGAGLADDAEAVARAPA